jgi:hypothetical protein
MTSVAIFSSTAEVFKAERVLLDAGVKIKLIPTPRQFSTDCGIAVRFETDERERVDAILKSSGLVAKVRALA